MLKRWIENIAWLFNHPPTNLKNVEPKKCDYCGAIESGWEFIGNFNICFSCLKKTFDKVLKGD